MGLDQQGAALSAPGEVSAVQDEMIALRRQLHAQPELGFEEHATSQLVAERLQQWGYSVMRGIGRTGVVGSLTGSADGLRIGLRADMDALPIHEATGVPHASCRTGVMHACGHDGHTATVLTAARLLAARPDFKGTVRVIFQPAEEGLGGAQAMLDEGLFERFPCDRLYGFHNTPGAPTGRFGIRDGAANASQDWVTVTVRGRGGHGARPHLCVDPVVVASHLVIALQSLVSRETHPDEMAIISVGAFHAGDAPNVIADSATLRLSVRSRSEAVRARLRERITEMSHAVSAAHRASVELDYHSLHPVTVNDPAATTLLREVIRELWSESAIIADWPASPASDDMALLLQRVPGCYFNVGNGIGDRPGEGGCPVHSPRYDFNDAILPSTAAVLVALVRRFLASR